MSLATGHAAPPFRISANWPGTAVPRAASGSAHACFPGKGSAFSGDPAFSLPPGASELPRRQDFPRPPGLGKCLYAADAAARFRSQWDMRPSPLGYLQAGQKLPCPARRPVRHTHVFPGKGSAFSGDPAFPLPPGQVNCPGGKISPGRPARGNACTPLTRRLAFARSGTCGPTL